VPVPWGRDSDRETATVPAMATPTTNRISSSSPTVRPVSADVTTLVRNLGRFTDDLGSNRG
jgi:hypothetical protein